MRTAPKPTARSRSSRCWFARQSATWPEFAQRVAQWVDPEKAISLIREPELKSMVAKFAKRAAAAASKLIY